MRLNQTISAKVRFVVIAISIVCANSTSLAEQRKDVRFYKVNKQEQPTRLFFTRKKGRQAGCHNFLKKARVHRVNQFGYQHCSLYTKKDCAPDSITTAIREKDSTPITQLTQGFSWFPESEHKRGKKLKSWSCAE